MHSGRRRRGVKRLHAKDLFKGNTHGVIAEVVGGVAAGGQRYKCIPDQDIYDIEYIERLSGRGVNAERLEGG
jgi:hypothetical protein